MARVPSTFRRWLLAGACALAVMSVPDLAAADPISAAIVTAIGLTGTAATIATFVITTALNMAAAYGLSKLATPKNKQSAQERQASVTTLSLGEVPREAVFGRVCTAGSLVDAFNFGGTYGTDWECLVIALADHELDAVEGFIIDGTYYPWTASGLQAGFSNCLDMEFINAKDDVPPPARFAASGFGATDRLRSVAKMWFAYKANETVWPQGRPSVKFVVRGKRCYDPRLDDTVPGGMGLHRWNDPATWTWTQNAQVCRYNWVRGIYALDQVALPEQLLIGRGLTAVEAPPERIFAAANVCDEAVALRAGGTEPRYRVNGVIRADEDFDQVEQMFAAAMAGVIVQREGGVEIEPGQAKSAIVEITDLDLVAGETVMFDRFLPDPQRINSVIGRYVEPAQGWSDHAAPIRRSVLDIQADGRPKETSLSLSLVTSGTQGQRCAEIERRLARLERRSTVVLPPRFSFIEEGDWIGWTSERRHNGGRVVYRVEGYSRAPNWRRTLALREISALSYSWTPAIDEIIPGTVPAPEPARPAVLALSGVAFTVLALVGDDGSVTPAVKAVWATPVDPAVIGIRLEVRVAGEAEVAATTITTADMISGGQLVTTNGVPAATGLEARLSPLADPSREVLPSDWTPVTTGASSSGGVGGLSPAEVDNRNVPIGLNAAINGDFTQSAAGFFLYGVNNVPGGAMSTDGGRDLTESGSNYFGARHVLWSIAAPTVGTWAGAYFYYAWANGGYNGNLAALKRYGLPVRPGDRVGFRWLLAAYGASAVVARLRWFNAAGGLITPPEPDVAAAGFVDARSGGRTGLNGDPANFYEAAGIADAPADAAFATLGAYAIVVPGQANTLVLQTEPQLVKLAADQTTLPPYTPGPSDRTADQTGEHISAGFFGQGGLATLNQVAWAVHVTGVGKPEDFATKSVVYRQAASPTSPGLNDIWVQLNGSGNPIAVGAWNGASWIFGADLTALNISGGFVGQQPLATQVVPSHAGNAAALAAGLTAGMSYLDTLDSNRLKVVVASTTVGPVPVQIVQTDTIPTSGTTETSIATVGSTNPTGGKIKLSTGVVGIGGGPNASSFARIRIKATYGGVTTLLYDGLIVVNSDGSITTNGLSGGNGLMVANPGSGAVTYSLTRQRAGSVSTGGDQYQVNVLFEWVDA